MSDVKVSVSLEEVKVRGAGKWQMINMREVKIGKRSRLMTARSGRHLNG